MAKRLTLKNGCGIPQIGFGTWLCESGKLKDAIKYAVDTGYRHVDCAYMYGNQVEAGEALAQLFQTGKVKREEMFVTSKIWNTFHSYEMAKKAIGIILGELKLDYVDLMLIHWPMGYVEGAENLPWTDESKTKLRHSDVDYADTWRAMEEAVAMGQIRSIGLSNFDSTQVKRVMESSKIPPAVLQVEIHPYLMQQKLVDFCREQEIVLTAYSPLANFGHIFRKEGQPNLLDEEVLRKIGQKYAKTPAQVALRWSLQRGCVVLAKSVSKCRIKENFAVFDFDLLKEEMKEIDGLNRNWRITDIRVRDGHHKHFPKSE